MTRARWLLAFALGYLALFAWLRSTATVTRVLARREEALGIAHGSGLSAAEVLGLLDLAGQAQPARDWRARAQQVVAGRGEFGDLGLAVSAAFGHAALVRQLAAGATPEEARARLRARPEGIVLTRFVTMTERYDALLAPPHSR